ncbi:MAG: hydroxymethylbilane synthase [Bacteroidota bacterium]
MAVKHIRIGTRGSRLALWQAEFLREQLTQLGLDVELKIIKTQGDRVQDLGFDKLEGKGFFTKEIEEALLRGDVDLAVHSMKDLPTTAPEGLCVTAVSYRENPADWLLIRKSVLTEKALLRLPEGARVGTSSARRKAQIRHLRPDVVLGDIRGNVPTRVQKLRDGQFDAILLAAAGLQRLDLDLSDLAVIRLNVKEFVPAPAQGVLAYQVNTADTATRRLLRAIHHPEVSAVTNIERRVLQLLDGGCQLPLGAYCERDAAGHYHLWAALAESWDAPLHRVRHSSSTTYELAEKVVAELREKLRQNA